MRDPEQPEQLARATGKLAPEVMRFRDEIGIGVEFTEPQLRAYCELRHRVTGDTPARTLRKLRLDGLLNYEVVKRSESRYRFTRLATVTQREMFPL